MNKELFDYKKYIYNLYFINKYYWLGLIEILN